MTRTNGAGARAGWVWICKRGDGGDRLVCSARGEGKRGEVVGEVGDSRGEVGDVGESMGDVGRLCGVTKIGCGSLSCTIMIEGSGGCVAGAARTSRRRLR
jgi:hypothetical protein